jgi:RES domain-containing protein
MLVYRITKKQYANLDGIGGLLVAGRWHEKGYPVVYFSESRSLALLEYMVHLDDYHFLPADIVFMTLKIPSKTKIAEVEPEALESGWESSVSITRKIGSDFLKNNKGSILRVPTVIVPDEYNYLINPLNEEISKFRIVKIEPFMLDTRIGGVIH